MSSSHSDSSSKHSSSRSHQKRSHSRDKSSERRSATASDPQHRSSSSHHHSSHRKHSRSRSRSRHRHSKSRSKSRERHREKKDSKREQEKSASATSTAPSTAAAASSTSDLKSRLKQAKKLLQQGDTTGASSLLSEAELTQLLTDEQMRLKEKEKERKERKEKKSKKESKKRKKRRKDSSSGSDDDSSNSASSASDTDASPLLSDGKTPRLHRSDYFQRSNEYRVWLHTTYGKHMDDISSSRSHRYFRKFIDAWNSMKLPSQYYNGLNRTAVDTTSLTKHKWKMNLTDKEKENLIMMKDNVDSSSRHSYKEEFQGVPSTVSSSSHHSAAASSSDRPSSHSSSRPSDSSTDARTRAASDKRYAAHQNLVLEELVPKATGREAQLEKRREKGSYAHMDKHAGEMQDVSDKDLMGSTGTAEYQTLIAKRNAVQSKQSEEQAAKVAQYKASEKAKMQNLLSSLGLQGKYQVQ